MQFIFVAGIIIFAALLNSMKKGKNYSNSSGLLYRYISIVILVITGSVLLTGQIISIANKENRKEESYHAKRDGYVIDYYKVKLDVDKSQNVEVTENIGINFYEDGHHGIYRRIPEWLPYTNQENNTVSRRAEISNISVKNEDFSISTENSRKVIKIGDANKTLTDGLHPYELSYNYNLGPDEFKGYDEFIYHIFGNYWGTEINNAYVEIHLPNEFDGRVRFYSDKYRKKDITEYVDFRVDGNTIYANVNENYDLLGALTVDVILPDGYFDNSQPVTYGYGSLLCCICCLLISGGLGLLWFFKGKDLKPTDVADSYSIPDDLDPAAIGYIYKKSSGIKLAISLVLQLAIKGFIKIDDRDGKTTITRNISEKGINDLIDRKIEFRLLVDYNDLKKNKNDVIKNFFNKYIKSKKDIYTVDDEFDKFLEEAEYMINESYITIDKDTLNDYSEEALKKILEDSNIQKEKLSELNENEKIVYDGLFADGTDTCELSKRHDFYLTISELDSSLTKKYYNLIYDVDSYKYMFKSSVISLLNCFLYLIAYFKIEDLHPSLKYMYLLAASSVIVSMIFTALMGKKTSYGENLVTRIDNFKKNIKNVDVDKFKNLVDNYNDYAYSIIPYAYVLDVSNEWKNKFKDLPVYKSDDYYDYYLWNDSNYSHIYNDFTSATHSNSSSSGCGGGCSSCGGGCSSCGGGGSW